MNRVVLRLMCDERGDISFLFGPWGAIASADAIRQIEAGERTYTLQQQDGSRAPLVAVGTGGDKRLRARATGAEPFVLARASRIGA